MRAGFLCRPCPTLPSSQSSWSPRSGHPQHSSWSMACDNLMSRKAPSGPGPQLLMPLPPPTGPSTTIRNISDDSDGATTHVSQSSNDDQEIDLLSFFLLDDSQDEPQWEGPVKKRPPSSCRSPCHTTRLPMAWDDTRTPSDDDDKGNEPMGSETKRPALPQSSTITTADDGTNNKPAFPWTILTRLPCDGIRCIISFLTLSEVVTLSSCCRDLASKVTIERVKQIQGTFRDPLLLMDKLPYFRRLRVLDLTDANFGQAGAIRLSVELPSLNHLKALRLGGNYVGVEGIRALSTAFLSPEFRPPLLHLDLSDNDIGRDGAESIARAIHHSAALQSLEILDLAGNNLGMKGVGLLSTAFAALACPKLQCLYFARNGFFGLEAIKKLAAAWDAGALPQLHTLDLAETPIFSTGARELAKSLLRCPFQLVNLNLSATSVDARGCRDILEALQKRTSPPGLQSLDLSCNRSLGRLGAQEVATGLKGPLGRSLRVLDMAGTSIGGEGAMALGEALQSGCCPEMEELCLSDNHLGPQGGRAIFEALELCPTTRRLKLANASLCNASVVSLAGVFDRGGLPNLTYLDISGNNVKEGMVPLCRALGTQLVHLDLGENRLGVEGASVLGRRLQKMPALEYMDISSNSIGSPGVKEIMPHLPSDLNVLDLSDNGIDQEGGEAIARRLRGGRMPQLRVVNLAENYITAKGTISIADSLALGSCPKLEELSLASNAIGDDGLGGLCEVWRAGWDRHLRELDLSWNGISAEGASKLAHGLKTSCPVLNSINLHWNFVGVGACALAEALEARTSASIQILILSENGIGGEGAVSLAKALSQEKYAKFQKLVLSHNPIGEEAAKEVLLSFTHTSCPTYLNLQAIDTTGHADLRRYAAALRSKNSEVIL